MRRKTGVRDALLFPLLVIALVNRWLVEVCLATPTCFTLVSDDRQHPGYPAGVVAGRVVR